MVAARRSRVAPANWALGAVGSPKMSVAPLQFLLLVFAGWVNRRQLEVVEFLQEENRVLREHSAAGACASPTPSAAGSRRRAKPGSAGRPRAHRSARVCQDRQLAQDAVPGYNASRANTLPRS